MPSVIYGRLLTNLANQQLQIQVIQKHLHKTAIKKSHKPGSWTGNKQSLEYYLFFNYIE